MTQRHLAPLAFAVLLPLWTAPAAAVSPRKTGIEKTVEAPAVLATGGRTETLTAHYATQWLTTHAHLPQAQKLPDKDVSREYLNKNSEFALKAKNEISAAAAVSHDLFLTDVLPYRHFDEPIDAWREPFYQKLKPLAENAKTLKEVAEAVFPAAFTMLGATDHKVKFKGNLTPQMMAPVSQTIANGHASCTGLSILIADAFRSVGLPARVVGTALWNRKDGGNHNWVEAWTGEGTGDGWHFFDADPAGLVWDKAWFTDGTVQLATKGKHGIVSPVWGNGDGTSYELSWRDPLVSSPAIDRTSFYQTLPVNHAGGGELP